MVQSGAVLVVRFTHPHFWDETQMAEAGRALVQLISKGGHSRLLLDLSAVQDMSSSMIGQLVKLNRAAEVLLPG